MSTAPLILPPADAIAAAVAELSRDASPKYLIALNKAQFDLMAGMRIIAVPGAFLVPSSSRGGIIHRVNHVTGCDCEAGRKGRICRHKLVIEIVQQANTRVMPRLLSADRLQRQIAAERATALLNECF